MKLSCPSCHAKYSVPAEKVVGKVVKARCKKCGDALVVLPSGASDPYRDAASMASEDEDLHERRARARREGDLFGAVHLAGSDATSSDAPSVRDAKLTGQRNDTSVLFSLGALSREAAELEKPSRASGAAEGDGSGLIDIRALSAVHGKKSDSPMPTIDDLVNLGGGGAFGPARGLLDAPLPTSAAEERIEAREGKRGLWLAIVGATVFFTVAVVLALIVTRPLAPTIAPSAPPRLANVERDPAPLPKPSEVPPPVVAETPKAVASVAAVAPKEPIKPVGTVAAVGTVKPKTDAPIVPPPPSPPPTAPTSLEAAMRPPFNRGEAAAALSAVGYVSCRKPDGPTGNGHVYVTFDPSGTVASAVVDQGAFMGTPVGGCIAGKFRGAHVPAFSGGPVKVGKTISL